MARSVEGVIVEVMETWPLQLALQTADGLHHVSLTEGSVVRRADGSPSDLGSLRQGEYVRIDGDDVTVGRQA